MITKNFKKLQALTLISSGGSNAQISGYTFKNGYGTEYNFSSRMSSSFPGNASSSYSPTNSGIRVGSGTTPPTEDDYNLQSVITTGLTGTVTQTTRSFENGYLCAEFILSLANTSTSDIEVSEIGYFQSVGHGASNGTSGCLIDRTLLDTPITIPPNESATITYTLKLPVPSNLLE